MPEPKHKLEEVRTESEIIRTHRRAGRDETDAPCVRECTATVRMMMALGWDDDTMCIEFGVTATKLAQYKRVIISKEQATLSHRPPGELYVEHRLMVMDDVHALGDIASKAVLEKQFAAATNARRARSQLLDKLLDRGQEMGVIPRAAKRHEVVGGLLVAQLTERELLEQINKTAKDTRTLIAKYGGKPFTAMSEPTDLYREDPEPETIAVEPSTPPAPVRRKATK